MSSCCTAIGQPGAGAVELSGRRCVAHEGTIFPRIAARLTVCHVPVPPSTPRPVLCTFHLPLSANSVATTATAAASAERVRLVPPPPALPWSWEISPPLPLPIPSHCVSPSYHLSVFPR